MLESALLLTLCWGLAASNVLTPPYINIAENSKVEATYTCGEDGPELYCKLIGANQDARIDDIDVNIIHGQVCDICDVNDPVKGHLASAAVDGTDSYWMSPPLSRGMTYSQVNFTIDLGQEFHVAYVILKMGISPRPEVWVLEKSSDNGATYSPWQYFADTLADCERFFGRDSLEPITRDDSVICDTRHSKIIPLEDGEIVVSLLNDRPSANDFFNSSVLQEWTRANKVRLRLLQTKTLFAHLMSFARQDPSVTRRYFYSIRDINIGGRCRCNGHAEVCLPVVGTNKKVCDCKHNTTGDFCERCRDNLVQKKWRQSKSSQVFECEECNCHGHSSKCVYNETINELGLSLDKYGNYEGGGVCQECEDFTEGINCEKCIPGYYRPLGRLQTHKNACERCKCDEPYHTGKCAHQTGICECKANFQPPHCDSCALGYFAFPECKNCTCFIYGTEGGVCEPDNTVSKCECKPNFDGPECKVCREGYYSFPDCEPCNCQVLGSSSEFCNITSGQCECRNNFGSTKCDQCAHGYFDFPQCTFCKCDPRGTVEEICDKVNGQCLCKEGFGGERCDKCVPGYKDYPDCQPCSCSDIGSTTKVCDVSGKCDCLERFSGKTCTQCAFGYYKYPECLSCNCETQGTIRNVVSCDDNAQCKCRAGIIGKRCDSCEEGLYNFPACEECDCDPAGVLPNSSDCGTLSKVGELCQCKPRVTGRKCKECKPLYWNLQYYNPYGCEECRCDAAGVIGGVGVCDPKTGQCLCKENVESQSCDTCVDGTYNLQEDNLLGCTDCSCDIGGALDSNCNKETGACTCRPRIEGRSCDVPMRLHYFPTLHQFQYELEDGYTPGYNGDPVSYGYEQSVFPGFSWRGYAVFNQIQNVIKYQVNINADSIHYVIMRYVNRNENTITGFIHAKHEDEEPLESKIYFKPSTEPAFAIATGSGKSTIPNPLVTTSPGRWEMEFNVNSTLFIDYFVLLPQSYFEGNVLIDFTVREACKKGDKGLCRQYAYPSLEKYDTVYGDSAFVITDSGREAVTDFMNWDAHQAGSNIEQLPMLTPLQKKISFEIRTLSKGPSFVVINYGTPQGSNSTADIGIEIEGDTTKYLGSIGLSPCQYTWLCRYALLERDGNIAVFHIDDDFLTVTLELDNMADVGVESVSVIPYDNKTAFDFIKLSPVCVIKDGNCRPALFTTPLDHHVKKVEFEAGNEDRKATETPPRMQDNNTALVYLKADNSMMDLTGKVSAPGNYTIIVHYYQPYHPDFNLEVLINGVAPEEGSVRLAHCPSSAGCRAVIRQNNGNQVFSIIESYLLSFKVPNNREVWLDYVLIIPDSKFSEDLLIDKPEGSTNQFLTECTGNMYHVDSSTSEFCRSAIFSLTTHFNNGALGCACHPDGSYSLQCVPFGGQCQCKENIIGRRCQRCKTGYYQFPQCKPCNCPENSLCNEETGQCSCPANVVGENCDQCANNTFGYFPLLGCRECECNYLGLQDGNLQCDPTYGTCNCKENVIGRQCDSCTVGYYLFPECLTCDCELGGTTYEICNNETGTCLCKENVESEGCDICRYGSFNLQGSNKQGCTKCFCFEHSQDCRSSGLYKSRIFSMTDWGLATVLVKKPIIEYEPLPKEFDQVTASSIGVTLSDIEVQNKFVYFKVPEVYLGNRLTSYGGYLTFNLLTTAILPYEPAESSPVIILKGAGLNLLYYSYELPPTADLFHVAVEISESNFVLSTTFLQATRPQLMQVLKDLEGIYIKATYWKKTDTSTLNDVKLDSATDAYSDLGQALSVEQCTCDPQYTGLSCEECASGYYRSNIGPYGGNCVPCQCNGHTGNCDKQTGICIDCQHNTTGDNCEQCAIGYHGDARIGTPYDCLICACPLPLPSNNFAVSCELSPDGYSISCNCKKGYFGSLCESCAVGYYGTPREEGAGICQPCECSGNIDPDIPGSCDSITGKCIKCLNNTFGEACNICAPGFYGDAVLDKNCQSCVCDKCGAKGCDHESGACQCHDNVKGEACDSCIEFHYGLSSCQGCTPCECGPASETLQCDLETGNCKCKPGVTGRTCDRCDHGYWNYTSEGCTLCSCNTGYSIGVGCNPVSGKCECLPGVIGEKCDHCPHRWVLDNGRGCFSCDKCIDDLLDNMDVLHSKFGPFAREFIGFNESFFTRQRIVFIEQSIDFLKPNVSELENVGARFSPIKENLDEIEDDVNKLLRTVEYIGGKTNGTMDEILRDEAEKTGDLVATAIDQAKKSVMEVIDISESFMNGEGSKYFPSAGFNDYLIEARNILSTLESFKPDYEGNAIRQKEFSRAENLLQKIRRAKEPVDKQTILISNLKEEVKSLNDKLEDLKKHSNLSSEKAKKLNELTKKNREQNIPEKFKTIKTLEGNANSTLKSAEELLLETNKLLALMNDLSRQLTNNQTEWEDFLNQVSLKVNAAASEIDSLRKNAKEATDHAGELEHRGEVLKNIQKEHEHDTNAVQGYKNIVNTLRETLITAENARMIAENASEISEGIGDKAFDSRDKSTSLNNDARNALSQSQRELEPELQEAKKKIELIQSKKGDIENDIKELESNLNKAVDSMGVTDISVGTKLAEEAAKGAEEVQDNIKGFVDDLPGKLTISREIQNNIKDTEADVKEANESLNKVQGVLPDTKDLILRLKDRPKKIESNNNILKDKLTELERQIETARELANSVSTAVKFDRNSILELRNPPSLPEQGINNMLSLNFASQDMNGLLFFLGNEAQNKKRSIKTGDFIALEIENEMPKLTVDLGNGATTLICDIKISVDEWYFVKVERTGKSLMLKVTHQKDGEQCVKSGVMKGSSAILNLDKASSKFFVGGIPNYFKSPLEVSYFSFVGMIEEMYFGESYVGLWNFQKAENIKPAQERGITKTVETGCRFNGDSFVAIDSKPYKLGRRTEIVLRFKTLASEGILFLAPGPSFISIEIREGRILYQFDLGSGPLMLVTSKTFNDGEWHSIEANRYEKKGNLKVDGYIDKNGYIDGTEAPGDKTIFEPPEKLFIGGFPREHNIQEVTELDFDGCIDEVQIDGTSVDLNIPENSGTIPGCPPKFASVVSFEDGVRGHVLLPNISAQHNSLELILRFKTSLPNGLLAYADFGGASASISLREGQIEFIVGEWNIVSTSSVNKYNDSNWHVVMATYDVDTPLQLIIDDYDSFSSETTARPMRMLHGNLYFGGVPSKVDAQAAISKHFSGCISDATLNGVIINFGNLTETPEAVIGKCIEGARRIPLHRPPALPPPRDDKVPEVTVPTTEKIIIKTKPTTDNDLPVTTPGTIPEVVTRPDYSPNCKVPLYPTKPIQDADFSAYRIGTSAGSRLEYYIPNKIRLKFNISVDIKTAASEGLIFYIAEHMHVDFVAVYISQGKVNFRFDCGSGPAHITSELLVNDDKWHHVRFQKQGFHGTLIVDNEMVEGKSPGNAKTINNESTYYLGGLDPSPFLNSKEKLDKVLANLKGINNSLDGCLKNFKINNQLEKPRRKIGVIPCDAQYDNAYFHPEGGYVKLYDRFRMGKRFDISLEIKPRSLSGLLLAVHSADAFFVLEMDNGEVKMTVDIGSGDVTATYKPKDPYLLCDGNWHKITCAKAVNALSLGVDNDFLPDPVLGKITRTMADTKHALYLGGHPKLARNIKDINSKAHFIGCIKNLKIKTRNEKIDAKNIFGNVTGGVCPD